MPKAIDKEDDSRQPRREWSSTGPRTKHERNLCRACRLDMNGKSLIVLKRRLKLFYQTSAP